MTRICEICGSEFWPYPSTPNQIFCSAKCGDIDRHLQRKAQLAEIMASRGCMVCGIKEPTVLLFHHRDPTEKEFDIGMMVHFSWRRVSEEMAKCDVLCANHHLIVHADMRARKLEEEE